MSEVIMHDSQAQTGVTLTDAALKHFLAYLQQKNASGLRLSVRKAGCSGYAYEVAYVNEACEGDLVFPLTEALQIYIDKASYPFLKGLNIDYVKQGINQKLVFENPNQTGQCGCGESFIV